MRKCSKVLLLLLLWPSIKIWTQDILTECEDLHIGVEASNDSLCISLSSQCRKIQMSFLMQGVRVGFVEKHRRDTAFVELPNADDVRNMIKRHPNEVKAMHDVNGSQEVRPDLLPLVAALNSQKARLMRNGLPEDSCLHHIAINKENGIITFVIIIPLQDAVFKGDSLVLTVCSTPKNYKDNAEFRGNRRSRT